MEITRRRLHFAALILLFGFASQILGLLVPDTAVAFFSDDPHDCDDVHSAACEEAEGRASLATSITNGVRSFLTLLLAPMVGSLSDAYGRYGFFLVFIMLTFAGYLALVANLFGLLSLWPFFGLQMLSGLTVPMLLSMVADENEPQHRAAAFGLLLATWDVAVVFVPAIMQAMSKQSSAVLGILSFVVATVLVVIYGETLPAHQRMPVSQSSNEWLPHNALKMVASTSLYRRLSLIVLGSSLASAGAGQCFLLYLKSSYGLEGTDSGTFTAMMALSALAVQGIIMPILMRYLRVTKVLMLGLVAQVVQNSVLLIFRSIPAVVIFSIISGFGSLCFPCISAIQVNAVHESKRGRIQGAVSALKAVAEGVGQLVYGSLFDLLLGPPGLFGHSFPQGIYALCLLTLVPLVPLAAVLHRYLPEDTQVPGAVLQHPLSEANSEISIT